MTTFFRGKRSSSQIVIRSRQDSFRIFSPAVPRPVPVVSVIKCQELCKLGRDVSPVTVNSPTQESCYKIPNRERHRCRDGSVSWSPQQGPGTGFAACQLHLRCDFGSCCTTKLRDRASVRALLGSPQPPLKNNSDRPQEKKNAHLLFTW